MVVVAKDAQSARESHDSLCLDHAYLLHPLSMTYNVFLFIGSYPTATGPAHLELSISSVSVGFSGYRHGKIWHGGIESPHNIGTARKRRII